MLLTKTVTVKWYYKTKEHYINKGYIFTNFGDEFEVKVEDLSKGSHIIIENTCDYCGEKCKPKAYATYIKLRKDVEKDCCEKCQSQKVNDVNMVKYGGHYNKTAEGKNKISKANTGKSFKVKNLKYDIDFCRKEFLKKNLLLLDSEYISCMHQMNYICLKHEEIGVMKKSLSQVLNCVGCPQCAIEINSNKQRLTQEQVEKKVLDFTNGTCILVGKYTSYKDEIELKCSCGNIFKYSSLANLRRRLTRGCPSCNQSRYSRIVEEWLIKNKLKYETEYKYDDLKGNKNNLKFDFSCHHFNVLIEVDGELHFFDKMKNEIEFNKQNKYDKLKNDYCINNNIKLIRIPYWDFNNEEYVIKVLDNIILNNKDDIHIVKNTNHYDSIKQK